MMMLAGLMVKNDFLIEFIVAIYKGRVKRVELGGVAPPRSICAAPSPKRLDLASFLRGPLVNYRFIVLIWIMPSRNVTKYYIQDGFYHIYNRGVEKRNIFLDDQDYNVFLNYLAEYLLPKDRELLMGVLADPQSNATEKDKAAKLLRLNNFYNQIQMICFCLMQNHFHFLIKQTDHRAMDKLMNSLCTRYTMYFNKKYDRIGYLYQDVYKAVEVESDEYLLHLSRYIHKQATFLQPSSYKNFLGDNKYAWVYPNEVLAFFTGKYSMSYAAFMNQEEDPLVLEGLTLEDS